LDADAQPWAVICDAKSAFTCAAVWGEQALSVEMVYWPVPLLATDAAVLSEWVGNVTSEKDAPPDAAVPPGNAVLQVGVGVGVGLLELAPITLQACRVSRMGMIGMKRVMAMSVVVRLRRSVSGVEGACITELAPFGQAAHVKRMAACLSCLLSIYMNVPGGTL
jgi:hypothetical protein